MNASEMQWVAVSGGSDLEQSSARAVSVSGLDIAIWRSGAGTAHAWENRCPHRGMRMSFGQVRDDNLVCRYHGWSFDESGRCQSIPASPGTTPPPTACVEEYACREALGLIWISTTGDDEAALAGLMEEAGFTGGLQFCKTIYVNGSPDFVSGMINPSRQINPGVLLASVANTAGDTEDILIAVQASGENRCAVHVVIASDDDADTNNLRRLHFGQWAQRLRWHLENPEQAA